MFRLVFCLWLPCQLFVSAATLEFTDAEKTLVNSAARLASLPGALQQRVADHTLAWMTDTNARVLACWEPFGGGHGVIVEPKPDASLLRRTRQTCAASLAALAGDAGPEVRSGDMLPAIQEFQRASRSVVQSAMRALETGIGEAERARAVEGFSAYCRTLEAGRLPAWMLQVSGHAEENSGIFRHA